jgi:integrase
VACTARTGELKRLLWRHVDLVGERVDGVEMGRLEFWRTKNGEPRAAWVSGQALEKLRALKSRADARGYGGPDDPVFLSNRFAASGKIFRFLRPLQRACRRAGVPVITFHTTRHISGTLLARSGATHEELKAIGGWKSDVVKVYVHMAAQDIKDRVAKMHREKLDS